MPASPLTLQELKSDLWNCAQILRGSAIERPDWKGYVLPLLFFKRISDVWDEETVEARETYGMSIWNAFRSCTAARCREAATGATSARRRPTSASRRRVRCAP